MGGGGNSSHCASHSEHHDAHHDCILNTQIQLSEIWKKKYEEWLEVEVFSSPHDWDKVLSSPTAFLELKAMEF